MFPGLPGRVQQGNAAFDPLPQQAVSPVSPVSPVSTEQTPAVCSQLTQRQGNRRRASRLGFDVTSLMEV